MKWLYFNPFFGEQKIHNDNQWGIAESGVNLLFWSAIIGVGAHLAGSKHAVVWGGATFAALVGAEIFFSASGHARNGFSLQMNPAPAPATATPGAPYNGQPATGSGGFAEVGTAGYGEEGGYTQSN